jgi:hypothetical protein
MEANIEMKREEIGWGCVDRINLAQNRDRRRISCEHGNETSGSMKGREFVDWFINYQLLKDSIPWNWLNTGRIIESRREFPF